MSRVRITSTGSVAADVMAPVRNPMATLCTGLRAAAATAMVLLAAVVSAKKRNTKRLRSCSSTANCTT